MKKTIFFLGLFIFIGTLSFAQDSSKTQTQNKITLKITQEGKSETYTVKNVSYDLERTAYDTLDNRKLNVLMNVTVVHSDKFFLQTISGEKGKTIDISLRYYNSENKLMRTIESDKAYVFAVSGVIDIDYKDLQGMYLDCRSDNVRIDGIEMSNLTGSTR